MPTQVMSSTDNRKIVGCIGFSQLGGKEFFSCLGCKKKCGQAFSSTLMDNHPEVVKLKNAQKKQSPLPTVEQRKQKILARYAHR